MFAATLCSAAQDRIAGTVDTASTTALKSQVHRNLWAQDDRGAVDPAMPINYATLYFQPAGGLEAFLADQQNPSSPNYHRWLTPEQFGERFGLTPNDLAKITGWLKSEGFTIHDVARGRHWITFSGTASQAAHAFHAEIHSYAINGRSHYASATDVSVPAALASVVAGVEGLDDFRLQPYYKKQALAVDPDYTTGSTHYLVPDDIATIYDIAPLYSAGIDGTGQQLVIIGQTDIDLADIRQFRKEFGLSPNDPQVVLYGQRPIWIWNSQAQSRATRPSSSLIRTASRSPRNMRWIRTLRPLCRKATAVVKPMWRPLPDL
jgi:subtilase family serine protease